MSEIDNELNMLSDLGDSLLGQPMNIPQQVVPDIKQSMNNPGQPSPMMQPGAPTFGPATTGVNTSYSQNIPSQTMPPMIDMDAADAQARVMGVKKIAMGQRVSSSPVERFKGTQGMKSRISIIADPFTVTSHYDKKVGGSILCFGGDCCRYLDSAKVKYCFPVIQYPVMPQNGALIPNQPCELKLLAVGNEGYQALCSVYDAQGGSFDGYDLLVTCTDQQYQKLTFTATRDTARNSYSDIPNLIHKWSSVEPIAYQAIARQMDEDTFKRLYFSQDVGDEVASFGDIMNMGGTSMPPMGNAFGGK